MNILLLGASGLLGHNVAQKLLSQNHSVTVLVRDPSKFKISHPRILPRKGNILSKEDLLEAMKGCDAVINCAGTTNMSLLHLEDYRPVNSHLCSLITDAMEALGIKTLVHVSTANTIGFGKEGMPASEKEMIEFPFSESFYAKTKLEGELLLKEFAEKHQDGHLVIVNPGFMIGAFDTKPSSGALLLAAYRKPIMVVPKGGKSFIHVQDAAEAIVNALQMGRNGERYLLTNENLSLKEFYALQARVMGYRQWMIQIPNWLLTTAGWLGDGLRALGIPTQLCTRNVRQLMVMEYYNNSLARRELKMAASPIESAVKNFFEWRKADKS